MRTVGSGPFPPCPADQGITAGRCGACGCVTAPKADGSPRAHDDITQAVDLATEHGITEAATRLGVATTMLEFRLKNRGLKHTIAAARAAAKRVEQRYALDLALLETAMQAIALDRRCVVCEAWILRPGATFITCSPECAEAWPIIRYYTKEGHKQHREHVAKVDLRSADPTRRRRAEQVLDPDTPTPPPNRRFIVPGSRASKIVKKYRPELLP